MVGKWEAVIRHLQNEKLRYPVAGACTCWISWRCSGGRGVESTCRLKDSVDGEIEVIIVSDDSWS